MPVQNAGAVDGAAQPDRGVVTGAKSVLRFLHHLRRLPAASSSVTGTMTDPNRCVKRPCGCHLFPSNASEPLAAARCDPAAMTQSAPVCCHRRQFAPLRGCRAPPPSRFSCRRDASELVLDPHTIKPRLGELCGSKMFPELSWQAIHFVMRICHWMRIAATGALTVT